MTRALSAAPADHDLDRAGVDGDQLLELVLDEAEIRNDQLEVTLAALAEVRR